MQTSSVMRTSGVASTSRHTVNRSPFQKSPAPVALRQRNLSTVRAEANNTGGSKGGSITNSGKTEQPDSYEVATSSLQTWHVGLHSIMACWLALDLGCIWCMLIVVTMLIDRIYVESYHAFYARWSVAFRLCSSDVCIWRAVTAVQVLLHDRSSVCLPLQRIEAPVRNNDSADKGYAYDGKDISDRQTDVDRLLVDQNQPEEQRFLGTAVAFPDALRFKGAAPEIVNSRYCYPASCCVTGCRTSVAVLPAEAS